MHRCMKMLLYLDSIQLHGSLEGDSISNLSIIARADSVLSTLELGLERLKLQLFEHFDVCEWILLLLRLLMTSPLSHLHLPTMRCWRLSQIYAPSWSRRSRNCSIPVLQPHHNKQHSMHLRQSGLEEPAFQFR